MDDDSNDESITDPPTDDNEVQMYVNGENITNIRDRPIPKPLHSDGNGMIKHEMDRFSKDLPFFAYVSKTKI